MALMPGSSSSQASSDLDALSERSWDPEDSLDGSEDSYVPDLIFETSYNPYNSSLESNHPENAPQLRDVAFRFDVPATDPREYVLMKEILALLRFINFLMQTIRILKNPPPSNTPQGPSKDVD